MNVDNMERGGSDTTSCASDISDMAPREEKRIKYLVEKILDTRKVNGEREYLILWQDYGIEEASWEKSKHCECPDAIAEFYRKRRVERFYSPYKRPQTSYTLREKKKVRRSGSRRTRSSTKLEEEENESISHLSTSPTREEEECKYQVQSGRRIHALLGVQQDGDELIYIVRYEGRSSKDDRIECVPSSVLRECALENFVDCLEELALASCDASTFM